MGRGRKVALALAATMLAAGLGLLAYPYANQIVFDGSTAALKQSFMEHTRGGSEGSESALGSTESAVDVEGLYAHLKAENERLFKEGQNGLVDAFSYEQPAVDLSQWGIYDNCIGFVSIPAIDTELPIYLGANDAQMEIGAVHLTQTSYPIGTENSNAVIAAHRGTWNGLPMFHYINRLHAGDEVIVTNFREELVYKVSKIKVIRPTDVNEVLIQDGRDMVTLITCHPEWNNYERYAVYCERT